MVKCYNKLNQYNLLNWLNKPMSVVQSQHSTTGREYLSSVSPKGQITLPLDVRQQLGLKAKDKVRIRLQQDGVRVSPAHSTLEASFQAIPPLATPLTVEE